MVAVFALLMSLEIFSGTPLRFTARSKNVRDAAWSRLARNKQSTVSSSRPTARHRHFHWPPICTPLASIRQLRPIWRLRRRSLAASARSTLTDCDALCGPPLSLRPRPTRSADGARVAMFRGVPAATAPAPKTDLPDLACRRSQCDSFRAAVQRDRSFGLDKRTHGVGRQAVTHPARGAGGPTTGMKGTADIQQAVDAQPPRQPAERLLFRPGNTRSRPVADQDS